MRGDTKGSDGRKGSVREKGSVSDIIKRNGRMEKRELERRGG